MPRFADARAEHGPCLEGGMLSNASFLRLRHFPYKPGGPIAERKADGGCHREHQKRLRPQTGERLIIYPFSKSVKSRAAPYDAVAFGVEREGTRLTKY
jgi:hypothetical protein